MSSFSGLFFQVKTNDGFYPLPARDNDGVPYVSVEAMFTTEATYLALQNKVCRGTPKVPIGTTVVNWHAEAGGSTGELQLAAYQGQKITYTAALVEFTAAGLGRDTFGGDPWFRADMKFVILSDVTP